MKTLIWLALAIGVSACSSNSQSNGLMTSTSILPNFQGQWSGVWTRQSCSEQGAAFGTFCSALAGSNPLRLTLTQSGSSVQGTLELGQLLSAVSGPISSSGALSLSGSGNSVLGTVNVTNWQTSIVSNTLQGSFNFSVLAPLTVGGSVSILAALQGVVRLQ